MSRRAFSLIEILITSVVAAIAFAAFLTVLRAGYQYSSQTRYRTVATILAQTMIEEITAHPYGEVAPPRWGETQVEQPARIFIQGRPMKMEFTKRLTYLNRSFVDQAVDLDYDVVKIEIHWSEAVGNRNADKVLKVEVPVWR